MRPNRPQSRPIKLNQSGSNRHSPYLRRNQSDQIQANPTQKLYHATLVMEPASPKCTTGAESPSCRANQSGSNQSNRRMNKRRPSLAGCLKFPIGLISPIPPIRSGDHASGNVTGRGPYLQNVTGQKLTNRLSLLGCNGFTATRKICNGSRRGEAGCAGALQSRSVGKEEFPESSGRRFTLA